MSQSTAQKKKGGFVIIHFTVLTYGEILKSLGTQAELAYDAPT